MKKLGGIGDVNTANKLAQWAYYALAGAVLAPYIDVCRFGAPKEKSDLKQERESRCTKI